MDVARSFGYDKELRQRQLLPSHCAATHTRHAFVEKLFAWSTQIVQQAQLARISLKAGMNHKYHIARLLP